MLMKNFPSLAFFPNYLSKQSRLLTNTLTPMGSLTLYLSLSLSACSIITKRQL